LKPNNILKARESLTAAEGAERLMSLLDEFG